MSDLGQAMAAYVMFILIAGIAAGAVGGIILWELIPWLWHHLSLTLT